jgi:putative ABC transport system ATP-binding protein
MFLLKKVRYKNILQIESLTIPTARITCVIGESGGGKTTFLKLLNHMISPDEGEIFYRQRNILSYNPVSLRREVVMLAQNPAIFPGDVAANLNMGRQFMGKPPLGADELAGFLKLVRLSKSLEDDAENLSGGEKQRLALARILMMGPAVLLLDEPSSALDEDTEASIIRTMVDFAKKESRTLVMVTHSSRIAVENADYIVKISAGRLVSAREVERAK